jgi:hypothetical protein
MRKTASRAATLGLLPLGTSGVLEHPWRAVHANTAGASSSSAARHRASAATLPIFGAMLLALLIVLGLGASFAQAAITHPYTGTSFGPGGVRSGSFGNVEGITVEQTTGDVLVLDAAEGGHLYKFDAAGAPVDFSSSGTNAIEGVGGAGGAEEEIAVDSSGGPDAGDIYVANNSAVRIYAESGAFLGELSGGEMCGVAVDPSGDVYVGIYPGTVRRYAPVANPVTNTDENGSMGGLSGICNVAADGAGDLYAANYGGGVHKYEALQFGSLSASGTLVDERGPTLAVDGTSGEVFIDEGERVSQYDGSIEPPEFQGASGEGGALSGSFGVAVDHASGKLYVGDETAVKIFGPGVVVASASTEAAREVSSSSATLHGSVEPAGTEVTGCVFEYGSEAGNLNQIAPCEPVSPYTGTTPIAVSAHLTGLQSSASYHYRITANSAGGSFHSTEELFETLGPPAILTARATGETQRTAGLEIAVAPHGLDTHYDIEYGTTTAYGATTSSVDLGSQGEVVYDYPAIAGLATSGTYHFRVVATNAEGTVETADQVLSTKPSASIAEESAYHVGGSSVTVSAQVEDYGTASTYRVEYGTTTSYGSTSASTALAGVEQSVATTSALGELQPATTYHVRLVVENEAGTADGPDVSFTTKPLTAASHVLPDGRLYERVSPADNADGNVYQDGPGDLLDEGLSTLLPFIVAPDGGTLAYDGEPSEHGGTGHEGNITGNEYLARRTAGGGWSAENVTPSSGEIDDEPVYQGFSPDLSVGFLAANGAQPLAEGAPGEGFSLLYARTFNTGRYAPLITSTPPHRTPEEFGTAGALKFFGHATTYAGASADLSHVLFMANDALTAGALDGGPEANNLYDSSDGTTVLVNVLPDGSTEANATFGGPAQTEVENPDGPMLAHDISEDGRRIFWTDLNTQDLYVRENDTAPPSPVVAGKCTVAADACTVLVAENARFWNATPDGSKVLYSQEGDLYEYDLDSGQRVDLAPHGSVNGVLGASEDLSYVYFVAKAVLAPGAESVSCEERESAPESSHCNLYAIHLGEPIKFIGALQARDDFGFPGSFYLSTGDWRNSLGDTEAEATPDGTHLLFGSKAHLTGYESKSGEEVFLYDFPMGQLSCVSCSADGEAIEKLQPGFNFVISAYLPVSNVGTTLPQWVSDDGDRVFFDSATPLVPQDTNEKTDVYEWERNGTGSCTQSNGCIYLISDGTSAEGSFLVGGSTSGDDVFFTTRDKMVPEDENENVDVYDARADAVPPPTAPQCTGTGCQGVPAAPPVFATPPSVTYAGVGNFAPASPVVTKKVKSKSLTQRRKLAKALKGCRKKPRRKRVACEKRARKQFATKSAGRGK